MPEPLLAQVVKPADPKRVGLGKPDKKRYSTAGALHISAVACGMAHRDLKLLRLYGRSTTQIQQLIIGRELVVAIDDDAAVEIRLSTLHHRPDIPFGPHSDQSRPGGPALGPSREITDADCISSNIFSVEAERLQTFLESSP